MIDREGRRGAETDTRAAFLSSCRRMPAPMTLLFENDTDRGCPHDRLSWTDENCSDTKNNARDTRVVFLHFVTLWR